VVPPSRLRELARAAAEKASIYEELQVHGSAELRSRLNTTDGGAALPPVPLSRIPFGPPPPPLPIPFWFGSGIGSHATLVPASAAVDQQQPDVSTERRWGSAAERLKAHRIAKKSQLSALSPSATEAQLVADRVRERLKKANQRASKEANRPSSEH
jgi:hypothetical protein